MKKTTVITETRKCDEYHAVFSYGDMERMLIHLMVDRLVADGKLVVEDCTTTCDPDKDYPGIRAVSRLCEPDGDMGWPGFSITLMVGDTSYYPKTLEGSYRRNMGNVNVFKLEANKLKLERPGVWQRLLGLFRPRSR